MKPKNPSRLSQLILTEGKTTMKIEFDPLADALYIQLAEGEVEKTEELKPGMLVDYDSLGNMLGIEVLYISKRAALPLQQAA